MSKRYTIGTLIGNAISPHIQDLIQGISLAAKSMEADVLFYLGIHSGYHYKLNSNDHSDKDFDYQFNTVYDYHAFSDIDVLIIEYGSLGIFLSERERKDFFEKFHDIPKVFLEERIQSTNTTSIITDNYNGMYSIAEHLVKDHGYRNITYLGGPENNTDAYEREKAVREVMKKYSIPFDNARIIHGNFSTDVQNQVNQLLDRYPDMEAMICANDSMAETAYIECSKRGLAVGHDIAITGYDNCEKARLMDPPLTTVMQSAKDMGYIAVIGALELLNENKSHTVVIPARTKIRESCGCCKRKMITSKTSIDHAHSWEDNCEVKIKEIYTEILSDNPSSSLKAKFVNYLMELMKIDFRLPESEENINIGLRKLMSEPIFENFSVVSLLQMLEQYVDDLLEDELSQQNINRHAVHNLLLRKRLIHEKSNCYFIRNEKDHMTDFLQETCYLPLISRDMLNYIQDEKEFYRHALTKLSSLNAASSYLYLLKEPVVHQNGVTWECPGEIFLAAYQDGIEVHSFDITERPKLCSNDISNPPLCYRHTDTPYNATILCLFSGEVQYGILVAEIPPSSIILFYLISRELGNMLRLYQLSQEQLRMRHQLEHLVLEIQEKNEALNYISAFDPLTECLNRRGLMKKAASFFQHYEGREAILAFADLDHLKEINDVFGHAEGDYSIKHCGEILKQNAGDNSIVARIGGDEFCVLIPGDSRDAQDFVKKVKEQSAIFNESSDKQYYIELSIGFTSVLLEKDLAIPTITEAADQALYAAKKLRKTSICK